jgi:hypothetical protein
MPDVVQPIEKQVRGDDFVSCKLASLGGYELAGA